MSSAKGTVGATSSSGEEILRVLKLTPAAEAAWGNIEASRVTSRVVASIPTHTSQVVQIACALEAIEREDYKSWPSTWQISSLRVPLFTHLTELCSNSHIITGLQKWRYQELQDYPHLLQRITHGLTRKLPLSDKKGFVDELISAGQRQSLRGDEASALDEENVLHITLSYKHANKYSKGGTIDNDTAEEAYEIICKLGAPSCVRVWVDQNLHRYPDDGPWYERGFLPYAIMTVVSALGKHGGFRIARYRPWIWAETGMALAATGIHCRQDICSTIEEVIVYPENSLLKRTVFENMGRIIPTGFSVFNSLSQMLRSVSCWTPDMLSHNEYEHRNEFRDFVQWAKAQVARLEKKQALDLSSDMFKDTILENICWMRALPMDTSIRQRQQGPYLRLEMDIRRARKQISLLKVSGKCRQQDGIYELLGQVTGSKTFCFTISSSKLCLNVNPSQRPIRLRFCDAEGDEDRVAEFELLTTSRGGYSLWDRRFPPHELPRYLSCGTVFGRHFGFRHKLGQEGCDVELSGFRFTREGFMSTGRKVEAVYVSRSNHGEIYLCESDILCIRELIEDIQKELIIALSPRNALPSMARILKVESDITNANLTPRTIGTTAKDIEFVISKIKGEDVDTDEVNIRRIRIGEYLHCLVIDDNRFGKSVYTFQTTVVLGSSLDDLMRFKMEGDIVMTLSKIRLMMGSDEFSGYAEDGLSLGIGARNGTEICPYELRLEGSEFLMCERCNVIYSPINLMECVLSSNMRTRKIRAQWREVHKCSAVGRACNIIGMVE